LTSYILAATVALALAAVKLETLYQANSHWFIYILNGFLAFIIYDPLRILLDAVSGKDPIRYSGRYGEIEISKKEPVLYYFKLGCCIAILVVLIHVLLTWEIFMED
tara:strand:+ start:1929 stop:2246 length:318 start_codon:yes stop_codon:yes gene_type:complete